MDAGIAGYTSTEEFLVKQYQIAKSKRCKFQKTSQPVRLKEIKITQIKILLLSANSFGASVGNVACLIHVVSHQVLLMLRVSGTSGSMINAVRGPTYTVVSM